MCHCMGFFNIFLLTQTIRGNMHTAEIRYKASAISPHRVSLNKLLVDMNNAPLERPTMVDASSLSDQLALSLAAGLTDHRLETTPSAR